jgi:hypothetical protein
MSEVEVSTAEQTRPGWVWVISLYMLLGSLYGLAKEVFMLNGIYLVPDQWRALVEQHQASRSWLDILVALSHGVLNIAAAGLLLALRRHAYNLFMASLILIIVQFALAGGVATLSTPKTPAFVAAVLMLVIGLSAMGGICAYTWHLRARGVLK